MRWPIRNQILLPLLAVQVAVVLGVSAIAAWWSLSRVESEVQLRLDELTRTVRESRFPLTPAVLDQLRGLSGAEFVTLDRERRVVSSTLDVSRALRYSDQATNGEDPLAVIEGREYLVRTAKLVHEGEPAKAIILYPNSLVQSARHDALVGPVWLGCLTLAVTTVAVVLVAHRIGRRIHDIERQVARVAGGDFLPIPLTPRHDELRTLSASVNRMGQDLERMTLEIRDTERARLIKQLAGGIAHQLRNALTGARMAVQVHQRRCQHRSDESLDVALRQLALTEEQIRGLVALIRDQQRQQVPGTLDELTREVEELLQPMCDHRHIELVVSGDAQDVWIRDSEQMRAALLNLCMNAIEAAGPRGRVEIHLSRTATHGVVEVRDDGPGVPAELGDSLFDPFRTTKAEGLGLGLALVRQAAEDHQGDIRYSRDGGWTVFRLTCRSQRSAVSGAMGQSPSADSRPLNARGTLDETPFPATLP